MLHNLSLSLDKYKFIDLFAGIGGFRLAMESLGAVCVFSSEWDKHCQAVYTANFGEKPAGDITAIDEKDIPDHNILCAGIPCQPFSISGIKKGFEDTRGTLFFDVARIVKEKKPEVVLIENVKNLVKHDNGRTLKVMLETLDQIGYNCFWQIIDSSKHGVPQKRERIFIVAFRKDLEIHKFKFPEDSRDVKTVKEILLDNDETEKMFFENLKTIPSKIEDIKFSDKPKQIAKINKGRQGERIYSVNAPGITISATGGGVFSKTGGYYINGRVRKLHPRECARMMGFPEDFKLHESSQIATKQFGNSVVVDVVQLIAEGIGQTMSENFRKEHNFCDIM